MGATLGQPNPDRPVHEGCDMTNQRPPWPDDRRCMDKYPFKHRGDHGQVGKLRHYWLTRADVETIGLLVPGFEPGKPWLSKIEAYLLGRCGLDPQHVRDMSVPQVVAVVCGQMRHDRLLLDVVSCSVTIDGCETYGLSQDATNLLKALIDAKGGYVRSRDVKPRPIKRVDRVIRRLPQAVQECIETKPGVGSRLLVKGDIS